MAEADPVIRLNAALDGRYRIERKLGEGGMATVYLARDLRHDRDIALKVLREDLAAGIGPERFLEEVRITAKLRHPHILPLFDSGEVDGLLFYVMPLVEGESLKSRLSRERELPIADSARILCDVVDGLAAAHGAGVIHRDVKPANILLDGRHAVVSDFGIAKAVSRAREAGQLTTMGASLGTPAYMSPEQAAGDEMVDHRSDVYSVGVVAYELLAGRQPFEGSTHRQVLMAHITQAPDPVTLHRPGIPPELAHAVMRCLEKKPADRWQRVDQLMSYLNAASIDGGVREMSRDHFRRDPRPGWSRSAGAAVAVVLVGLGVWSALDSRDATGPVTSADMASSQSDGWTGLRLAVTPVENLTQDDSWDYVGGAVEEEIRQATARHAPEAEILRHTFATTASDGAPLVERARAVGATHLIESRYTLEPSSLSLMLDVIDVRSGELVRSFDPIRVPHDSVSTALERAGEVAAVAAMYLVFWEGDHVWLRHSTLPRTPLGASYQILSLSAHRENRAADAVDWNLKLQALEPELPMPYLSLRPLLGNAGRGREWNARRDSLAQVMLERASTFERDSYLTLFAPTRGDQIEAAKRLFRLTGGGFNTGYGLAFRAITVNDLALAREALDAQDFGHKMVRDWTPLWLLDAMVSHLEGDYEWELIRAEEGLGLPVGGCTGLLQCEPQLLQAQARALSALSRSDSAMSVFRRIQEMPGDRHTVWHILHNVALELRRHGHPQDAREAFRELVAWAERQDIDTMDVASSHYGAGAYERVVELLEPRFSDDGSWVGADDVSPRDRVGQAALLVMSLEALDQAAAASRYEQALTGASLPGRSADPRWVALVHASRGDAQAAVRELEAAFDDGIPYYSLWTSPDVNLFLHNRPELENIQDDPSFRRLMEAR